MTLEDEQTKKEKKKEILNRPTEIVSKERALWLEIQESSKIQIEQLEKALTLQKEINNLSSLKLEEYTE